jgi:transcriptional regulator with XRE-family HTH domain
MRNKDYADKIALKLRQIRQAYHLSINGMANKLGINWASYARNENSQSIPSTLTLCGLEKALPGT